VTKRNLTPDDEMGRLLEHRLQHTAVPAGEVCADAETLASYVDDGMSATERAEWEAHFATCAKCRRALALMSRLKETASPVWEGEAARENPQGGNLWVWMPLAACILVGAGIYFATRPPAERGTQVATSNSGAAAPVIQEARSEAAPASPASAPAPTGRVTEAPAKQGADLDALSRIAPAPQRQVKDARERKNGAAGDKADEAATVTGQVPTLETSSTRRAPAVAPQSAESTTAAAADAEKKSKAATADQFADAEHYRRLQQPAPKPQQQMVSGPRESQQSQQTQSQESQAKQSQPQQAQASGAIARSNAEGGAAGAGAASAGGAAAAGAAPNASNVGNVNSVNAANARPSGPTNAASNVATNASNAPNAPPPAPPAAAAVAAPAPATPPAGVAESVRVKGERDDNAAARRTGAMLKVASEDAKLEAQRQGLLGTIADPALPARQWRVFKFGQIEVTRDNGGSWINEVLQTDTAYLAIASPAPGVGWIVGSKGTVWHLGLGSATGAADGLSAGAEERGRNEQKPSGTGAWQARSVPTQEDLVSVTATSARDAMVVTRSGLRFVTRDGGKSWTRQ
jgi:hypothetical protein